MDKKFSSVDIFGVRVDKVTMGQAVEQVVEWVEKGSKNYIVTPNVEFVMAAQEDLGFKKVLNGSGLSIPDGAGLKLASDIQSIIAGVDFMEELCKASAKQGFTVGFLGGIEGIAKRASECLKKKYPGLKVVFTESGGEVDMGGNVGVDLVSTPKRADMKSAPTIPICDILFVAFGAIKQEKWIAKNLPKIPVKVAMGVGGSFDEISGKLPRIPRWVHQIGLKWLVRLILQPWRIKRQMALVRFVWMVLCRGTS